MVKCTATSPFIASFIMLVSDFDFSLPENCIALHPCEPRDAARLLHITSRSAKPAFNNLLFNQLPDLLNAGDVLVLNDSKVIPARLFGKRGDAKIEILLHKKAAVIASAADKELWHCFLRPAKRIKEHDVIHIESELEAIVLEKYAGGEALLQFTVIPTKAAPHAGTKMGPGLRRDDFFNVLARVGHVPLPPYIKRADEAIDQQDYQTVYAHHPGSVAAPTAGLHFTPELLQRCTEKNIHIARVTLHVGAGTFQPVKVDDTKEHRMHSEWAEISPDIAERLNQTRAAGGQIVAVGTTALRTLESAALPDGTIQPFAGETDIFITPGYRFKAVDRLVTNFHLPKSTLFMLVCAFSGTQPMKAAYQYAIDNDYRFYSYGDACLLERNPN